MSTIKKRCSNLNIPNKPEGYEFLSAFARSSGIVISLLNSWRKSKKLGGEVLKFCYPGSTKGWTYALSPVQQKIALRLKRESDERLLEIPEKPENYKFIPDLVRSSGIANSSLKDWLRTGKLGGEVQEFSNPAASRTGQSYALSPEQQKVAIRLKKNNDKRLSGIIEKPGDYEFLSNVANNSGIPERTLRHWLLTGKLGGETQRFLNQNALLGCSYAMSPAQQAEAIRLYAKK